MSMDGQAMRREARRLLRQMVGGAVIQRTASGGFMLVLRGQRPAAKAGGAVPAGLVEALAGRGLLQAGGDGGYCIAPAGGSWLQRQAMTGSSQQAYADQHRQIIETDLPADDGRPVRRRINASAAPLTFLCQRGLIDATEKMAGERLARDFYFAQLSGRLTVDWQSPLTRMRRSAAPALPETALAAKQRLHAALNAVGPELSGVLMDLCCLEQGLDETEKRLGWPRASAKVVLRLALDRLARHYGLGMCRQTAPIEGWCPEKKQC